MKLLVSVSGVDLLYHITGLSAAVKILTHGEFFLKPSEGTNMEEKLTGNGAYYLSTARSPTSSYFKQKAGSQSVIFVLDGKKLGQRYKMKSTDYWDTLVDALPYDSNDAYVTRRDRFEMEERVLSSRPKLPSLKYIKEIHASINDRIQLLTQLKKVSLLTKIPIWFYDDTKALTLLNKRMAVQFKVSKESFQEDERARKTSVYDYKYRIRKNSIKPWLEVWHAVLPSPESVGYDYYKQAKSLTDEGYRVYQRLQYSDALSGFNADLHNAKGTDAGHISQEREMLDRLIAVLRKEKLTPAQFIKKMQDKWYPRKPRN